MRANPAFLMFQCLVKEHYYLWEEERMGRKERKAVRGERRGGHHNLKCSTQIGFKNSSYAVQQVERATEGPCRLLALERQIYPEVDEA